MEGHNTDEPVGILQNDPNDLELIDENSIESDNTIPVGVLVDINQIISLTLKPPVAPTKPICPIIPKISIDPKSLKRVEPSKSVTRVDKKTEETKRETEKPKTVIPTTQKKPPPSQDKEEEGKPTEKPLISHTPVKKISDKKKVEIKQKLSEIIQNCNVYDDKSIEVLVGEIIKSLGYQRTEGLIANKEKEIINIIMESSKL